VANPVLKVVLQAVDEVTGVAKKAQDSVASFADKAKSALGGIPALVVGAALGAFFKSAIDEAAAAEVGMGRLATAVRNAGGDFGKLKPQLEDTVASVMKLSTATDDELRAALTNMITISGDVAGSQKNLALAADLAAFKHISLEEAATVVGKAMNGNVTAFNKVGVAGKDATTVLENARASFGGFAAKEASTFSGTLQRLNNQWGEFQEAVGTAILSSGDMGSVADGLVGVLAGLAGWVEQNEGSFRLVTSAVGDAVRALVEVGATIWEVAGPAIQFVGKYVGATLVAALNTAVWYVRGFASAWKSSAGATLEALGALAEKGGKLLKLFGVTVVAEAGTSLRQFGEQLRTTAAEDMTRANEIYAQSWRDLAAGRKAANAATESEERGHGGRLKTETEAQAKARLKIAQAEADERERILKDVHAKLEAAQKGLNLATAELAGYWQQVDREAKKALGTITLSKGEQAQLTDFSKSQAAAQQQVTDSAEKARLKFVETVDSASSIGLSLVSAANGMGKISDEAATALTSVINMGAAIAKFGIGSPEGIVSIVGGLAQLIGGWGSSAVYKAQQEASLKNTRALEELTRDLSDYNGAASGRTFSGVLDALQQESDVRGGAAFLSPAAIEENLRKRGLTLADAKKIAEKYGIDVENDQEGWSKLLLILKTRKYGSGQGNFADELASLTDSFDVLGTSDADDKIAAFRKFAARNVPILADALQGDLSTDGGRTAAIAKLRDLYTKSINAQIPTASYGNATAGQFRSLIATLIPLLGGADGTLASGSALGTGTSSDPIGGLPPTGGSVGRAAGGFGALGVPSLPTPTGISDVFAAGVGGGGVSISGGVTQNFYLTQRDDEPSEDFLQRVTEAVDLRQVLRYDAVRAAGGRLPPGAA
jgi:hypothetical protein